VADRPVGGGSHPRESCYPDGAGDRASIMERKLVCDDRLDRARPLYHALCARYPDRFVILCDAQGRILARHDAPTVSTTAAAAFLVRKNPRLN